jgi:riboflavin kinase/FMN adenylyltransferase
MPEPGEVAVVAGVAGLMPEHGPLFAVIGVFDGLHTGHRYLLDRLVAEARARAARPTVITFDSHPDEILLGAAPPLLLDPERRLQLLGEAGAEVVVVEHFDAALRATEYDDFIAGITGRTTLAGLLMTPDAAFGHDRRGTPEAVAALGKRQGFELVVVPPFALDGRSVRSSDIRSAIAAGDLATAERLLGRPYSVVASIGDDSSLRVAMPVALPPPGSYRVVTGRIGASERASTTLHVGDEGALRMARPDGKSGDGRLLVEFVPL